MSTGVMKAKGRRERKEGEMGRRGEREKFYKWQKCGGF
jgi:hypothetical protein